jgi:hypothetical protein
MNRMIKTGKQVWKVTLLMTILLGLLFGSGLAGEGNEILPINPVPDFQTDKAVIKGSQAMVIHGRGFIGRIGQNEMVIGDMLLPILLSTKYYRSNGTQADSSEFSVGSYAGYHLNTEREIIELWNLVE